MKKYTYVIIKLILVMAGFQYFMFASRKTVIPPFILSTRIYSCILLDNNLDLKWRGKYNEDTDLSIRILKAGYCTILFNSFLCGKSTTGTMSGGNSDELYKNWQKNRLEMAPWRARPQHVVDYSSFKSNELVFRKAGSG